MPRPDTAVIRNNEDLVKLILADNYDFYRMMFPEDAIEICVQDDTILYAADGDCEWNESYHKSLHPDEFEAMKVIIEAKIVVQAVEKERKRNDPVR